MTRSRFHPLVFALLSLPCLGSSPAAAGGKHPGAVDKVTESLAASAAVVLPARLDDGIAEAGCSRPSGAGEREHCLQQALANEHFCTATALVLREACGGEVEDDYHVAQAICFNLADEDERDECLGEALDERVAGHRFCGTTMRWRFAACDAIGEDPYDPEFDPADFDSDYHSLTHPNPYFPLGIGNRWEYRTDTEHNIVEVLDEIKLIEGVPCIVVLDQVFEEGDLTEDTDDWFCQAKSGAVNYFGEETKSLESYDGDDPRLPELVSIDGSFKHGRDGAKGGLIFPATPHPGDAYLEEYSLGNAEDVTEILSTTYAFGGGHPELDEGVPQALADLLCSGNCVVTKNYSLLEPGVVARKYYAPGIGVFLEIEPSADDPSVLEVVRLTDCNFDPRCATLPQP